MDGSRDKIKNMVRFIRNYNFYTEFFLQIEKNAKWTQENVVKKLKDNIEPKKTLHWHRTAISGISDTRKKSFSVRNLTESELSFLLEYVCNS